MNNPIFAGKGVTAHIQHNPAKKHRGQHNDLLFHEEHIVCAWSTEQMLQLANTIMNRPFGRMTPVIASETDILLIRGNKMLRIKRLY